MSAESNKNSPSLSTSGVRGWVDSKQSAESSLKIGIVIPIYNVAPYLNECLDSVANQSYGNFYAVLVNDGSTDNSRQIALDYVAKDSRFILIDKENGGLSSARNAGINYFKNFAESSKNTAESTLDFANIHTHKNAILNPQIDYIIFLDSDDFWEKDLLKECVRVAESKLDSAQNADIVWFNYQAFYDSTDRGGGSTLTSTKSICTNNIRTKNSINNSPSGTRLLNNERTQLEILGCTSARTITFPAFLKRAKERNLNNFWWAWQGMIDFRFLQKINLQFYEGIIHEDHLFAGTLFAQSGAIAILPQKLYYYRIRKGSTMSAWYKNEIPSYVKPFYAHFPYQKARAYFRIYSLVISVRGLMEFSKNSIPKEMQDDFLAITLPLLLEIICEIFYFYKDPYHLKAQTSEIIKELGADSALLPGRVGRYFTLYTRCWKLVWAMNNALIFPKKFERKIRHFIRRN